MVVVVGVDVVGEDVVLVYFGIKGVIGVGWCNSFGGSIGCGYIIGVGGGVLYVDKVGSEYVVR